MASLAELLRLQGGAFVGYPQMPNKTMPQPQGGYAEGFLSSATGVPQQADMSVLDPNQAAYLQGRQAGEPVNIAAMAAPAALMAKVLRKAPTEVVPQITIGDRTIPVTMHRVEVKEGNKLVNVNPATFDEAFKQTDWQYIGKNAEGGKPERIAGVQKYLETGKPMNASNAVVKDNGTIVFGDGRHRYAVLRDMGLGKIPMSMDEKSIQNAKKFGYID
jgi:hypothetical protein